MNQLSVLPGTRMETTLLVLGLGFGVMALALWLAWKRWGWTALAAAPTAMFAGHTVLAVMYLSGVILYRETVSASAVGLMAGCVLAFCVAFSVAYRLADGTSAKVMGNRLPLNVNLLVAAVGFAALCAGLMSVWWSWSSGMLTADLGESRRGIMTEGVKLAPAPIRWGSLYLAPLGLLAFTLGVLMPGQRSLLARVGMYAGPVGFGLVSVASVARHGIMLAIIGQVATLMLAKAAGCGYQLSRVEKLARMLIGVVLIGYIFLLPAFRAPEVDRSESTMEVVNADTSELVSAINGVMPGDLGYSLQSVAVYLSHQPVMLTRHMDVFPVGPYFGAFQFQFATKYLMPNAPTQGEIKQIMYGQAEVAGLFGNVWGTAARDAMIDFGFFGAMAQFGLFGLVGGLAFKKALGRKSVGWAMLCIPIYAWAAYSLNVSAPAVANYEVAMVAFAACGLVLGNTTFALAAKKAKASPGPERHTLLPDTGDFAVSRARRQASYV